MIWQNTWAFAGLLILALPVLIHLLSRKRAVLQKFPSLRFLDITRLLPTRSPNLSDIPLLLVRLGILTAAVIAFAQPLLISAARKQSLNASLARAIVVDTSRSMARAMAGSRSIADSARTLAEQLARDASTSVVLQTANVSNELNGAAAWLGTQAGRAEIVVVSDFQVGTIDSAIVANIPKHVGFRAVSLQSTAAVTGDPVQTTYTSVVANVDAGRTSAEWTDRSDGDTTFSSVQLYAATADRSDVNAARDAALMITSPTRADSLKPVGIVFRGALESAPIVKDAKVPSAAWMASALVSVRNNELLASSVAAETVSDTSIAAPFAVIAESNTGAPVVYAAQSTVNGTSRLVFFQRGGASSVASAALIAAVASAVGRSSAIAETEVATIPDAALKQLERAPQDVSAQGSDNEQKASTRAGLSDGRWLWLVALLLLGVEEWMRRTASRSAALEPA